MVTVPPGTKSGPEASSNMTDFRSVWSKKWCDLQKNKKVFIEILTVFLVEIRCSPKKEKRSSGFTCWFLSVISMGPLSILWARWSRRLPEAYGPPKVHRPQGHSPPCPPSRRPWKDIKTIICLSFIVLNNFFANMSVKKNCASPTKSLTACHRMQRC